MKRCGLVILSLVLILGLMGCSEKSNSYFGTWVVDKQLKDSPMGDFGNMSLEDIIGQELSFSKERASCFGDNVDTLGQFVENPEYIIAPESKETFEQLTGVAFSSIGIDGNDINQIVVTKDPERNTGIVFYVIDDNSLLVNGAGTFFLLKKK